MAYLFLHVSLPFHLSPPFFFLSNHRSLQLVLPMFHPHPGQCLSPSLSAHYLAHFLARFRKKTPVLILDYLGYIIGISIKGTQRPFSGKWSEMARCVSWRCREQCYNRVVWVIPTSAVLLRYCPECPSTDTWDWQALFTRCARWCRGRVRETVKPGTLRKGSLGLKSVEWKFR